VVQEIIPVAIKLFGKEHKCVIFAERYAKNKGKIQFLPSDDDPKRDLEAVRQEVLLRFADTVDNDSLWERTSNPEISNPKPKLISIACYAGSIGGEKLRAWAATQSNMRVVDQLRISFLE
jgi:hypothetical protein